MRFRVEFGRLGKHDQVASVLLEVPSEEPGLLEAEILKYLRSSGLLLGRQVQVSVAWLRWTVGEPHEGSGYVYAGGRRIGEFWMKEITS